MRRRRRVPEPVPPRITAIVIDGANVIASGPRRAAERIGLAVAWSRRFRPGLPITVFVDHSTFARLPAAEQQRLAACCQGDAPPLRLVVCPPGVEADVPLLQAALAGPALVVSNDRWFDHPDLRANVLTVQFTLARSTFAPQTEATWFRQPGHARTVPLADL
jgi:hypothetical protein